MQIPKNAQIYVAGHRGMAGSAIWRELEKQGYTNLVGKTSQELDLTNRQQVFDFFNKNNFDVVIDAAAKVGGILANDTYPADFLSENIRIQVNLMDAANQSDVDRFVFLGSSCIYPKFASQPIKENSLLTGELEPTNDGYAIAKIAGIMHVQASRRQFHRRWISAMPTNLYGPGDNFHPEHSHVLPALIRRIHEAKLSKSPEVVIWGSGKPRREFMHVDDLANAIVKLVNDYDSDEIINVGTGQDISIKELAEMIAHLVGYEGTLTFDTSKPDGTPRKLLDVSKLHEIGWAPRIPLTEGLSNVYQWYVSHTEQLREK